jgi:hypothetical protein
MPPFVILTKQQVWNEEYQKNLAVYRVKTAAYKANQPVPSDEEAQRLVEAGKVPAAIIEPEAEAEEEEEDEDEEESSPEPVKAPSPPKSKRRKTSEKVAPVVEVAPTPAVKASPKKEKSGTKKAKKEATPPPPPATTSSEKKQKKSKKAA